MIVVELELKDTVDLFGIVRDLRDQGLRQDTDFDFAFVPIEVDPYTYQTIKEKHVKFIFYKEEWATWFSLKWL